ncbi:AAA family ATPase [Streptomyces sp. NPDC057291]|uniref:AAA family ATPase n=1 Tax=Streptomyces sp. NPDC057291 TaxID=3346087 RepID=UPI0036362DE8
MGAVLSGNAKPPVPAMLVRSDGNGLLYPGHIHMMYGESESGKSWVALVAAAEELKAGRAVLFLDFESDAVSICGRLIALGVHPDAIAAHLTYVRPDGSPETHSEAYSALLARPYRLAVLDGMTDAYMMLGLDPNSNTDVAHFIRTLPRRIANSTGAAVVMIDHVVKSNDGRGRFPIGSQHKLSALDGAAFLVEPATTEPLGDGKRGVAILRVAKDRPAQVRKHSGAYRGSDRTQEAGRVVLDSTGEGTTYEILPPDSLSADGSVKPFVPSVLMRRIEEFLNDYPGSSATQIADGVKGMKKNVRETLTQLVQEGSVRVEARSGRGGGFAHFNAEPVDLTGGPGIFAQD